MNPTDILTDEHRVIEQVLDCLEKLIERSCSERKLETGPAREAIGFFRAFADQYHHMKEEAHLFPVLEAKGFPHHRGPTGVMLGEHEQGRTCIRSMDEAIDAAAEGDTKALQRFAEHGRRYIALLRAHIQKEDDCLFSMANEVLTDQDQHELLTAFRKVEGQHVAASTREACLKIANDLAVLFDLPRAAVR
jgi:hemerythrin-like domain-containing protein